MIQPEEILSLEFIKKADCYSGSKDGLRYRFKYHKTENDSELIVDCWPEPFNFATTKKEDKLQEIFEFSEDGIADGIRWLNQKLLCFKQTNNLS